MSEIVAHKDRVNNVKGLLIKFMPQIEAVLPKRITGEHFANVFLNVLSVTPKLSECDSGSMFGALLKCAMLGLIPDGVTNRASLVPRAGKVTFQIGYKGLKELAERHPAVRVVFPPVAVYEKDTYDFELGLTPQVTHKPCQAPDRGEAIAFYCVADLGADAPRVFEWMWRHEVEAIRNATPAWKKNADTPWRSHFERMGCKTVVKRLCSQLPSSPELAEAVVLDGRAEAGLPQNLEIVDVDAEPSTEVPKGPQTLDDVVKRQTEGLKRRPPATESEAAMRLQDPLSNAAPSDLHPPAIPPKAESSAQAATAPPAGGGKPIGADSDLYKQIGKAYDNLPVKERGPFRAKWGLPSIKDVAKWPAAKALEALGTLEDTAQPAGDTP